jgi:hypothetical protein
LMMFVRRFLRLIYARPRTGTRRSEQCGRIKPKPYSQIAAYPPPFVVG